jgi:DNA-binding transcriptional ArsR family regulator
MTDRNYILVPKMLKVEVEVSQVYPMMDAMAMVCTLSDYPGLANWVAQIYNALSDQQKSSNRLATSTCYHVLYHQNSPKFARVLEFADYLQAMEPGHLQTQILDGWAHKATHLGGLQTLPTREELLGDVELYLSYMDRLGSHKGDKEKEDEGFLRDMHELVRQPAILQSMAADHIRLMWNQYLAEEWEKSRPLLEESVRAFQQLDYEGLSGLEIGRHITGRDMSGTWIGDQMETSEHFIFMPAPHLGPYVGAFMWREALGIFFRPRLPEGSRQKPSAALNRAELLVRVNALADDNRLRILELFQQHRELCAQDIIELLDLSQSAASRHLRQLTATGYLIERRKEGAKCYSMNSERVRNTVQALSSFLSPS